MTTPKQKTKPKTKPKTKKRSAPTYPLSQVPPGYFEMRWPDFRENPNAPFALGGAEDARTLSPFHAALRLYQATVSLIPLITYKRTDKGRERARSHPAYKLLSERPNPAQSASVFWEYAIDQYFVEGESFTHAQWANNHKLLNLFPIPRRAVKQVILNPDWTKTYIVQTEAGEVTYKHDEVIHIVGPVSRDGIRGISFLEYARQSMSLHKQVLVAADSFYQNAPTPRAYISFPGNPPAPAAKEAMKESVKKQHAGPSKTGEMPVFYNGMEIKPLPFSTAEDAKIIEALGTSTADIARWFGVSPLLLGDLQKSTYSNLGADHQAFYVKSLATLLHKIVLEFNYCIFGADHDFYAEFLTEKILQADPTAQSQIYQTGIQNGYYLRSEVREWLNLPHVEGLDQATLQSNMTVLDEDGNPPKPAPAPTPPQPQEPDEQDGPDATDEAQDTVETDGAG